ncbi:MAG: hypothetical protein R3B70_23185 [Polyangiaceae bacterium]
MGTEKITAIVTVLVALSVASERLVEITKGLIPYLGEKSAENPRGVAERWRRPLVQMLTVASAVLITALARNAIPDEVLVHREDPLSILALGLLASGGSGFWSSILGYLEQVKNIKKGLVTELKKAGSLPPERSDAGEQAGERLNVRANLAQDTA